MPDPSAIRYREKIVARKCLNALIDVRIGLSRQNKLLEILIEEAHRPQESACLASRDEKKQVKAQESTISVD